MALDARRAAKEGGKKRKAKERGETQRTFHGEKRKMLANVLPMSPQRQILHNCLTTQDLMGRRPSPQVLVSAASCGQWIRGGLLPFWWIASASA